MPDSRWIWTPEWTVQYTEHPWFVLFRKSFYCEETVKNANIRISADSRYKLFINGVIAEVGPVKGDTQIWFYDEPDITPLLKYGENVITVMVLRYPLIPGKSSQSVISTGIPGLYAEGSVQMESGTCIDISADGSWRCIIDEYRRIVPETEGFSPLYVYEHCTGDTNIQGWTETGYDDSRWGDAVAYESGLIRDMVSPGNLNPRPIPFLYRRKAQFEKVKVIRSSDSGKGAWNEMLKGRGSITIPAHTEEIIEFDAGEEMTAYLHLRLSGGEGTVIRILQSESYVQKEEGISVKRHREDCDHGFLEGYTDVYELAGYGTDDRPELYEPFWFRTFRFIQLHICTAEEPVAICGFDYTDTAYPLEVKTAVRTSDCSLEGIWDISVRTLQRCMHETYEDCPFYEQLQYIMDARSQALYTYTTAADDRLARKCLDDFRRSQRYDGLLCSAYPNNRPNVIPGFSIYYILMLHDHMMYFGDRELLRCHMPAAEQILYFYESRCTEAGYVGRAGGLYRQDMYWGFIDWAPQWQVGVPNAADHGPLTMNSLLYIMGAEHYAEIAEFTGRLETAAIYREQAERVRAAVRKYCIGTEGMVQDGPGVNQYSQHCQVFAALTGVLGADKARENLLETIRNKEAYAQCTVAMMFYLFRALELCGLYEYTNEYWEIWREMITKGLTTCAEAPELPDGKTSSRSDCHAWGALALYELPAVILGVRPAVPGFRKVRIQPVPGYLDHAEGKAVTPHGEVSVRWKMEDSVLKLTYEVPEGMEVFCTSNYSSA